MRASCHMWPASHSVQSKEANISGAGTPREEPGSARARGAAMFWL